MHTHWEIIFIFRVCCPLKAPLRGGSRSAEETASSSHQRPWWTDKHQGLGRCSGTGNIMIYYSSSFSGNPMKNRDIRANMSPVSDRFVAPRLVCTPSFDRLAQQHQSLLSVSFHHLFILEIQRWLLDLTCFLVRLFRYPLLVDSGCDCVFILDYHSVSVTVQQGHSSFGLDPFHTVWS